MVYQMTPEEQELNDEANADPDGLRVRIERAILAESMFVVTALSPSVIDDYVVLLLRVGEADVKMNLSVEQTAWMIAELQTAYESMRSNIVRKILG